MSILYISYDGVLEPLGQSQVLAYLKRLTSYQIIYLISFEKAEYLANSSELERIEKEISNAGISWYPLCYHKMPTLLATTWDILCGIVCGLYLVLRYRLKIVHARSYVPSVMAMTLKKLTGVRYIFDMRGFWADERVDGGLWINGGKLYIIAKWFERQFLLSADRVISLTSAAVDEMRKFPYLTERMEKFEVITTCADLDLFKLDDSEISVQNVNRPFTLGYVGSVNMSYLFDATLICFLLLKQKIPDAQMHILNRGDHSYIFERLKYHAIDINSVRLEEADHQRVAHVMCQFNAGIFFIKQAYSKIASAPTKLGEFLGCGVPCLSNIGVGDMASIIEGEKVGVISKDFSKEELQAAVDSLLILAHEADIDQRCRQAALRHFSLENGVQKYVNIYDGLLKVKHGGFKDEAQL